MDKSFKQDDLITAANREIENLKLELSLTNLKEYKESSPNAKEEGDESPKIRGNYDATFAKMQYEIDSLKENYDELYDKF